MSAYQLVSLRGPGGIDKTTLALKFARRVLGKFADGGGLLELASLSDPTLLAAAVALRVTPEAIAQATGDRKLRLVLDDCEHLIAAVVRLAECLIGFCPHITIVATSREALRNSGRVYLARAAA
jgi:predicted ATPase